MAYPESGRESELVAKRSTRRVRTANAIPRSQYDQEVNAMMKAIAIGTLALCAGAVAPIAGCSEDGTRPVLRVAYQWDEPFDVEPPTRLDIVLYELDRQDEATINAFVDDCAHMGGTLQADIAIGASLCVDVDY